MRTLIMLPTYNEKENLEDLVTEILAVAPEVSILIIDDSSPDGTGAIALKLAKLHEQITVIERPPKSGRGTASTSGYKYAINKGFDYYMEMDVDHSHSPKELPAILEAAKNADMVIASRFLKGGSVEGWNLKRRLLHLAADIAVRLILGTPNTDHTNGYRCYRVGKLKKIDFKKLSFDGYVAHTLLENIYHRAGYIIKEVPSTFYNRTKGKSKMNKSEALEGIKNMIKFRLLTLRHGYKYFLQH
ncbi:MAG: polyprenol monophosphomannose synthase [Deltaproteobacteria bacterium]|nr:polyprenol monophosphomannose synthase [Deltaproteobacteria bacterium]